MANAKLFSSSRTKVPATDTVNEAGGRAYGFSDEHALAQYAVTGCLNGTYYVSAEMQLDAVKALASKVSNKFLAQTAIYAREKGLMKDMPALLLAILSTRDARLAANAFPRVCDDAKMVKNYVQIIRSGTIGRTSLGSGPKRMVQQWLASRTEEQLFKAVVGGDVSLKDLIKLTHPKPATPAREAFYRYLLGKDLNIEQRQLLPENIQQYEMFKSPNDVLTAARSHGAAPDVPFMLLTNLELTQTQWIEVGMRMSWSALRQNLNALGRHGVFENKQFVEYAAKKLSNPEEVRKAKAFPFQLYAAYRAATGVPAQISNALQDAMEAALSNVPELSGNIVVAVDNSGSMSSPATGDRGSATSSISCLDAASVMGSALLRRNPNNVTMMAFNTQVVRARFNGRDSVITNTEKLATLPGGGTDCACVLREMNAGQTRGIDAVIYLSDNESWHQGGRSYYRGSGMMNEFIEFKKANPKCKLVCIDIQPNSSTQAPDRPDVLNVGGFSDSVFTVVESFLNGSPESFVRAISAVEV